MSNFGDLIQEYHVRQFRDGLEARRRRLAQIRDADDVRRLAREAREKIRRILALPPPEKHCPLAPVLAGRIERSDFTIEKVRYHSRPDFPVTANLYLPARAGAARPGVLFLCGHYLDGKASPNYQIVSQALAKKGCVVLAIDPIGQGERRQFPDHPTINNVFEHNVYNRRMLAYGEHFGTWRVFDAVRGLDYLLSRPEVDPARVGVTGNSGGGTLTSLVTAVDERITASAVGCYITRFLSNVESELPVDAEQIPPGLAADGGDMIDLLIAAIPTPVLVMGQKNDFFDPRGAEDAVRELARLHTLLGQPGHAGLFIGPDSHGYWRENRRAAYEFFIRHFKLDADAEEKDLEIFPEAELYAAPGGRVVDLPGARTVHQLINERVDEIVAARPRPRPSPDEIAAGLRRILRLDAGLLPGDAPGSDDPVHYRQLRPAKGPDKRCFSRYGLETEAGLMVTMSLMAKSDFFHLPAFGRVELYLPHLDAKAELSERPAAAADTQAPGARPVFGLDYRGVGESAPNGCDQPADRDFFALYNFDYHYASLALLLDQSYLGGRVRDVMAALALLAANGNEDIVLTARGIGRVPAVLAAFLSPVGVSLRLEEPLPNAADDARSEFGLLPQSMIPFGLLALTDYDELQALIRSVMDSNLGKDSPR